MGRRSSRSKAAVDYAEPPDHDEEWGDQAPDMQPGQPSGSMPLSSAAASAGPQPPYGGALLGMPPVLGPQQPHTGAAPSLEPQPEWFGPAPQPLHGSAALDPPPTAPLGPLPGLPPPTAAVPRLQLPPNWPQLAPAGILLDQAAHALPAPAGLPPLPIRRAPQERQHGAKRMASDAELPDVEAEGLLDSAPAPAPVPRSSSAAASGDGAAGSSSASASSTAARDASADPTEDWRRRVREAFAPGATPGLARVSHLPVESAEQARQQINAHPKVTTPVRAASLHEVSWLCEGAGRVRHQQQGRAPR